MHEQDTICAVSTPAGEGGIGIIRVSGRSSVDIVARIFRPKKGGALHVGASHLLRYGHVIDPDTGEIIDEGLASVMRRPATYTREDVVEINCHGGMAPLWRTMDLLIAGGARQAEPGEFTKRAFLNGRIDLVQAEAVMDIIRAKTDLARRAANEQLSGGLSADVSGIRDALIAVIASVEAGIDFPEEEIQSAGGKPLRDDVAGLLSGVDRLLAGACYGKILRDGFATAIVGRPNVGKSSLLNTLLRQDRAIVTEIAGTTRDVLEEYLSIEGVPLRILDTAGIRHSHDAVEQEGVRRAISAMESADLVLMVFDGSLPMSPEDHRVLGAIGNKLVVCVVNKSDLPQKIDLGELNTGTPVSVSCKTGAGLERLRQTIADIVKRGAIGPREHAWAISRRHERALTMSRESLVRALEAIDGRLSPEFIAMDLRGALDHLGLIVGVTYTEDILEKIFNDFCIGK